MSNKLLILATVILLLLSACSDDAVRAKPINKSVEDRLECDGITCPEFSYCEDGKCICNTGFKKCKAECISKAKCCADTDCKGTKKCINERCKTPPQECGFHAEWDDEREQCFCEEGFKLCMEQNNCIPADNCCFHTDCLRNERCAPTIYSVAYCLKELDRTKCRVSPETFNDHFFFIEDIEYSVSVKDIKEGGIVQFIINEENEIRAEVNQTKALGNLSLWITHLDQFGGYCKEEVE